MFKSRQLTIEQLPDRCVLSVGITPKTDVIAWYRPDAFSEDKAIHTYILRVPNEVRAQAIRLFADFLEERDEPYDVQRIDAFQPLGEEIAWDFLITLDTDSPYERLNTYAHKDAYRVLGQVDTPVDQLRIDAFLESVIKNEQTGPFGYLLNEYSLPDYPKWHNVSADNPITFRIANFVHGISQEDQIAALDIILKQWSSLNDNLFFQQVFDDADVLINPTIDQVADISQHLFTYLQQLFADSSAQAAPAYATLPYYEGIPNASFVALNPDTSWVLDRPSGSVKNNDLYVSWTDGIRHEVGHILGLLHPDPENPFTIMNGSWTIWNEPTAFDKYTLDRLYSQMAA